MRHYKYTLTTLFLFLCSFTIVGARLFEVWAGDGITALPPTPSVVPQEVNVVCSIQGDNIEVENTGAVLVRVYKPNGSVTTLKNKETTTFKRLKSGIFRVQEVRHFP